MKNSDYFILTFIIIFSLGIALSFHTKHTQLTYKYNSALKEYIKLTKERKKLEIEVKALSSPSRIIKFASKYFGLHLPKLNEVYHIDR